MSWEGVTWSPGGRGRLRAAWAVVLACLLFFFARQVGSTSGTMRVAHDRKPADGISMHGTNSKSLHPLTASRAVLIRCGKVQDKESAVFSSTLVQHTLPRSLAGSENQGSELQQTNAEGCCAEKLPADGATVGSLPGLGRQPLRP